MTDHKIIIKKYALQNAIKFGQANPRKIISKVLGEAPELKSKAKEIMTDIKEIVDQVNSMSKEDMQKEINEIAPDLLEKKTEKRVGLKPLPDAEKGKVVLRFEPSPSGPMHIGHAYVFGLNVEYRNMYEGKLILRISDTNASNIDAESYDMLKQDGDWLSKNKVDEFIIQSDRLDIYYTHALKLLDAGHIYVCECDNEDFRQLKEAKTACPCRELVPEVHVKRWHKMFTDYKEGDAVVRFKSDIAHKNPAMRDFPLLRISDIEHPKTGKEFRVWPLMNFSVAIDDMESGVTHTIRGKDHADNAKKQEMIHNVSEFKTPIALSTGRINFEGFPVSCSKTRPKIEDGTYSGWDDIRIPFLKALARQGYQPEALIKYATEVGLTKTDKSVNLKDFFSVINSFNKDIVDPISNRYFFVKNPKKIVVEGAPEIEVELDLHPDKKKGGRAFQTKGEFFIDGDDKLEEGKIYRLMDCLNFTFKDNKCVFHSKSYDDVKDNSNCRIIHWVIDDNTVNVEVLMPNNTTASGIGEKYINDIKENEIVQLERFGFVRCDSITPDKTVFWFAHR